MNEPLPPISPELTRLLDAEREPPPAPPGARERVLARVEATVAAPAGGGAAVASSAASAKWLPLAGLATIVVVGAVWLATGSGGEPTPPPERATAAAVAPVSYEAVAKPVAEPVAAEAPPAPAEVEEAAPASVPEAPTPVEAVVADAAEAPAAVAPPAAVKTPSRSARRAPRAAPDLSAERALLEAARRAIAAGEPAGALTPLGAHLDAHPRGALSEERESLWIKALVDLGRDAQATRRAARFVARWPRSIHRPAVEALTAGLGEEAAPR